MDKNSNNHKFDLMYFLKDTVIQRYNEKVEDYRAIDNKNIQLVIFISAMIGLLIQFFPLKYSCFVLLIYITCFLLLFTSLIILISQLMPKKVTHIDPSKILGEYPLNDINSLSRSLKEISTEYYNAYSDLDRKITERTNSIKYSLYFVSVGILLLFLYSIYFKIG